ncbi:transporter substrate-binding domain-containing protein [Gallaecimonas kandeliae]|uniref:substrate-binding periplasmic protein n=1 Tax=Gallaecimonas kandeliae TaxID=3029055 RepID=UPI002648B28D|nr:transporter substrate-binding domain-containing protein [Gallaecimonas kandeliae]WKE65240.1 transporter substrate-binding domain-containing protein [Gallaecimonas kandeliae]
MKKRLFPLVLMLAAGLTQAGELRLRGYDGYPYNGTPDSDHPGFFIEAAKAIFAQHQTDVSYNVVPWNAMISGADRGVYDCLLGIHPTEAPELNFTRDPWTVMSPHLYVRPTDPMKYEDLNSFGMRRVAVIKDSRMEAALKPLATLKPKPKQLILVPEADGMDELVRRLRMGEVDVIAAPEATMAQYIKAHGLEKAIRDVGHFADPVPLYVACSNKEGDANLVTWLNQGRLELIKTGQWQELKKKYDVE